MPADPLRIALLGPESTGKSALCQWLAVHYGTVWVPEYARGYMESLDRAYTLDDIRHIASEQVRQEDALAARAHRLLFVDTEALYLKVWCEERFGACPADIEHLVTSRPYDLYLLTAPDIPWVEDPVRENPHRRDFLFDRYRRELDRLARAYHIVGGTGDRRTASAREAVDALPGIPG